MPAPKRPFPSQSAALEALDEVFSVAAHGTNRLEELNGTRAKFLRQRLERTKRALKAMVRGVDWRTR